MSGQLLVAGAGAAVGTAFFGQPALGWAVGSAVGGILFAPDVPEAEGPRLEDLTVQASNYGSPIPKIYGTRVIAGQVIWKTDIRETRQEQEVSSGKGGGQSQTQISYTYSLSFAVGLCEGEIEGISRIWADGKLIYDFTSNASFTEINQIEAEQRRGVLTIYQGSESQTADPVIESFEGSGNVPGFRGLAYIVFDDMQLQDYGNRMPNITAEVVDNGSVVYPKLKVDNFYGTTGEGNARPNRMYVYEGLPEILRNGNEFPTSRQVTLDWDGNVVDDIQAGEGAAASVNGGFVNYVMQPVNATAVGGGLTTGTLATVAYRAESGANAREVNTVFVGPPTGNDNDPATNDTTFVVDEPNQFDTPEPGYGINKYSGFRVKASGDESYLFFSRVESGFTQERFMRVYNSSGPSTRYNVNVTNVVDHFLETGIGTLDTGGNADIAFESDGVNVWVAAGLSSVVQWFTWDGQGNFTLQQTFTLEPWGSPWGDHTAIVADNGVCLVFGSTTPHMGIYSRIQTVSDSPVTIASIVTDLCERSGLSASDIDVSTLTDDVIGFSVARPSSARQNIDIMQKIGFFDIIESDWKLDFKKRGTASVRTLSRDDMSAAEDKPNLDNVINTTRTEEKELPKVVKVQYLSVGRDQQVSEQSVRRIITQATEEVSERLPVVMEDDKARQIAEVILHASWESRERHDISLSIKHLDLEPGDVVTFTPENGDPKQARIMSTAYSAGQYQISMVSEELDGYLSDQEGESVAVRTQVVPILGPAETYLLDLPLLQDQHNQNGIYVAGRGKFPNWPGMQLYQSTDEGVNYNPFSIVSDASIVGSATTVLGTAKESTFDKGNTVTIKLKNSDDTLTSTTEAALLDFANPCILQSGDGWEVLQFANATLINPGEYELDTFLRGRKGTREFIDGHAVGDSFIFLDAAKIPREYVPLSEYLINRYYKGVTLGRFIAQAAAFTQSYFAIAYRPYPPGAVTAQIRSDGQLNVEWKRAARTGGEWLDLIDVPLDESEEEYDVFVYQTSDDAILGFANTSAESFTFTTLLGDRQDLTYLPQRFLETAVDGSTEYFLIHEDTDVSSGNVYLRNVATNALVSQSLGVTDQTKYRALGDTIYRVWTGFGFRSAIDGLDTSVSTDINGSFTYSTAGVEIQYQEMAIGGGFVWGIENTFDNQLVKLNPDLTEVTRYSLPGDMNANYHRGFEGNSTHLFSLDQDGTMHIFNIAGGTWSSALTAWPSSSGVPRVVNPTATGFLVITDYKTALNEDAGWRLYNNAGTVIREQLETATYPDQGIGEGETPGNEHNWVYDSGTKMLINKLESGVEVFEAIDTATGSAIETIPRAGFTEVVEIIPDTFVNKYYSALEFHGSIGTGSLETFVFSQSFITDQYVDGNTVTSQSGTDIFRAKPATSTTQLRVEVHQISQSVVGRGSASEPVIVG